MGSQVGMLCLCVCMCVCTCVCVCVSFSCHRQSGLLHPPVGSGTSSGSWLITGQVRNSKAVVTQLDLQLLTGQLPFAREMPSFDLVLTLGHCQWLANVRGAGDLTGAPDRGCVTLGCDQGRQFSL
jgi:hypothetical protein